MMMDNRLYIRTALIQRIQSIVQSRLPNEACGLLAGQKDVLSEIIEVSNSSAFPQNSFNMDSGSLINAIYQIERMGLEWIGIMHSHPNGTIKPSSVDIKEWNYPNLLYGIATAQSGGPIRFYLYRWRKEQFIRQHVQWI